MRCEETMMDLILTIARDDDKIRAAFMNGSRVNDTIEKDRFQDYDIVYVVRSLDDYLDTPPWLDRFGTRLMMQAPERNDINRGLIDTIEGRCAYLMLFEDANRIDLSIVTIMYMIEHIHDDSLVLPLLDKDNILPELDAPNARTHYVKEPSEKHFKSVCNDFWWSTQNVAKGLAREELPFATHMFHDTLKKHLHTMLTWYAGMTHDFNVNVGYLGRLFKTYLPSHVYNATVTLYFTDAVEHNWNTLFKTCECFHALAADIAKRLDIVYCTDEAENMSRYINAVRRRGTNGPQGHR